MTESHWLIEQFENNRAHLRALAYRMLGSLPEAEDAIQESWLRLSRADRSDVENLRGYLTTVVARVCLDVLRSRNTRREQSFDAVPEHPRTHTKPANPEEEVLLADSVGLALMVMLDRLNPAERLAFVLHDLFGLSFDEISTIVDRSPDATRQLASRARRRIHGAATADSGHDLNAHRKLVEAFLHAVRSNDIEGLVAVLDPDFAVTADRTAAPQPAATEIRGAREWAKRALTYARGAQFSRVVLVEGEPGIILAPKGRLVRAAKFSFDNGKIASMEVIGDTERLRDLDLAIFPE
jgi:RNA polymerase sigma-70 factor (ECF subfamily)